MYAEFENNCDISKWSPNSAIVHAVSSVGPEGPYMRTSVAVAPFAHNPKVVRHLDGTWLMYTIGVLFPTSKLANCSAIGTAKLRAGESPGRTPGNHESNVTLFTASSLDGPWTRFGVLTGKAPGTKIRRTHRRSCWQTALFC
eukprot:m.193721 g.193721  ORF g.193721 m.193721 type:complete len:142 (-) comp15187_c0_seq17:760-1185(-)